MPKSLGKWCTSHFTILDLLTSTFRVGWWFEISLAIWGFDRLIRFIRLVLFNHSYFGFKKGSGTMDATIKLLSPDLVCLRLRRPPHFHWSPGQTAYLIMPGVSTMPFEAHPFTIASIDTTCDEARNEVTDKNSFVEIEPYWKELVFFINVHGGFTKKLGDVAQKGEKVKVFVDGPYGKSPDLTDYDTSVLIAGGSGVSFTLPLFLDSIR
jgi:ferric-chelate reductase